MQLKRNIQTLYLCLVNQNEKELMWSVWQNILVEIPLKCVNEKNKDLTLEGDGWRLISEDDVNKTSNNALSELEELFRKE